MEFETIIHELVYKEGLIDSTLKYANLKVTTINKLDKNRMLKNFQEYLLNSDDISELREVQNKLFDCENEEGILKCIRRLT
ncbi:hypothetical protein U8V72_20975 [Priestia filamentosa]|uniref:hypothetical protein n=1 Tax=Priestia filamentosa TaxID=1402861 RepID=UPI0005896A7F